jgi:hypothetical protein
MKQNYITTEDGSILPYPIDTQLPKEDTKIVPESGVSPTQSNRFGFFGCSQPKSEEHESIRFKQTD